MTVPIGVCVTSAISLYESSSSSRSTKVSRNSIGKAATHGCMRLRDEDIEWLYQFVPVGTKIYIY